MLSVGVWGACRTARADDVNITTSTTNGILLDGFAGTTAQVEAGVTVTNSANFNCPAQPPPSGAFTAAPVCASTHAWTLTNHGTIGDSSALGYSVYFTAGAALINFANVNGQMLIEGGAGGSVDNKLGATMTLGGAITIGERTGIAGTVTNAGTITSTGQAVGLWGGGTVTNLSTGTIIGQNGANAVSVILGTTRMVENSGLIQSNDSGFGTGVAMQNGTVVNHASGRILGAYNGIWANGSSATSITNDGYVEAKLAQGGGSGIEVDGGGTVVNSGTIKSLTSNGTTTDAGINFTGAGSITNSGTIMSATGGLAIQFNGNTAHTLTLDTGSILGGNVRGGTGADGLVLKGIGTESAAKFLAFETLSMQGTEWNLTGAGTFSTSADVQSGFLHVNGSLTTPSVTVAAGGTLGGSGTIIASGGVTVNGTIAPGNSIGTLNITGPYTQAVGSTYKVELNAAGQTDLINVTGNATINGGTVRVVPTAGVYAIGQHYIILAASGLLTGQFASVTDNAPFVDFTLGRDANTIFLDAIQNTAQFADVAQTRNQKASAGALQGLGAGNPIFGAALMLDVTNALRAFDLLSGEIHATVTGMLLDQSRFPRDAVLGRMRQSVGGVASIFAPQFATMNYADDNDEEALAYSRDRRSSARKDIERALTPKAPSAVSGRIITTWGQVFGNWGHSNSDGNAATARRSTGGMLTGVDATMGDRRGGLWRFGFAGGYHHTSVSVAERASSGGIDAYHLAAYAGTQQGSLGVRTGAAYSWNDITANRSIVFPGFADATSAGYRAGTAQVFGEVGYGVTYRQFAFEPFAAVAHFNVRTASFTETGGAAALKGFGGDADTTFSTVGLRAATALPWTGMTGLVAKGSLGWRHAFGTVTPTAELAFASSGTPFVVAGVPIARDAAAVELGLDGRVALNTTVGVAYTSQLAGTAQDHGVNANFVHKF